MIHVVQNCYTVEQAKRRTESGQTKEITILNDDNFTFSVPVRPMLPRIRGFEGPTVFVRLNAAAFIKFSACPMRRLYKGGVCFEIPFLKSLTTVTVNRFFRSYVL